MTLRQTIGDFLIIETKLENDNQTTSGAFRVGRTVHQHRIIYLARQQAPTARATNLVIENTRLYTTYLIADRTTTA
jgi:hypothetical protein